MVAQPSRCSPPPSAATQPSTTLASATTWLGLGSGLGLGLGLGVGLAGGQRGLDADPFDGGVVEEVVHTVIVLVLLGGRLLTQRGELGHHVRGGGRAGFPLVIWRGLGLGVGLGLGLGFGFGFGFGFGLGLWIGLGLTLGARLPLLTLLEDVLA